MKNDIVLDVSRLALKWLNLMQHVKPERVGLDPRCGYVYVGEGMLATDNVQMAVRFSKLAFVDPVHVVIVGDYYFYSDLDHYVKTLLEHYDGQVRAGFKVAE